MIKALFDTEIYIKRRKDLMSKLNGGIILLLGNRESSINFKDNWYPFRQDSTFLYYTGLDIANIYIVLDSDTGKSTLFGDELSIDDIIWTGPQPTLKELAEQVGIEEVLPISKLGEILKGKAHYLPGYRPEHIDTLSKVLEISEDEAKERFSVELIEAVVEQRNIKSQPEIETLHEACTLTSKMHHTVMSRTKAGHFEYEALAFAKSYAADHNSAFSFLPICTKNGHILHNHSYGNQLKDGDLLLFDGGLESKHRYAGDMTRTFPVSRRFSAIQADLYQIVIDAQKAAIKSVRPGKKFLDIHLLACKTIVEGLIGLGIMKGNAEEAVAAGAHTMFFQCGLGHVMGLDVHDMENLGEQYVGYGENMVKSKEFGLKSLRLGRSLEEGFVITIEPGIYIIPQLIDKFKKEQKFTEFIDYKELGKVRSFGGIRVEDDYLVTGNGIELLGEPLAKEIKEIEDIRSNIMD